MKLYSPKYYLDFKCIADRCEHSCCIGWEIDIDENTLTRYKDLKDEYGSVIVSSVSGKLSIGVPAAFAGTVLGNCAALPAIIAADSSAAVIFLFFIVITP
jgi:hypothetical protein